VCLCVCVCVCVCERESEGNSLRSVVAASSEVIGRAPFGLLHSYDHYISHTHNLNFVYFIVLTCSA